MLERLDAKIVSLTNSSGEEFFFYQQQELKKKPNKNKS